MRFYRRIKVHHQWHQVRTSQNHRRARFGPQLLPFKNRSISFINNKPCQSLLSSRRVSSSSETTTKINCVPQENDWPPWCRSTDRQSPVRWACRRLPKTKVKVPSSPTPSETPGQHLPSSHCCIYCVFFCLAPAAVPPERKGMIFSNSRLQLDMPEDRRQRRTQVSFQLR